MADLEREQARARTFQSEHDRLKTELDRLRAAAASPAPGGEGEGGAAGAGTGFDPDSFRNTMIRDVLQVTQLAQAVSDLKVEFPYADEALYGRLGEFGSADALRIAVESSHNRVAGIVGKQKEAIEAQLREEFATKIGGGGEGAGAGNGPAGDPTVEQLAAMSMTELDALEKANPGVVDRVLRSASS